MSAAAIRDGGSVDGFKGEGECRWPRWHDHVRVVHGVMEIAGEAGGVKGRPASEAGRTDP
jgi:hypothetical protein